MPKLLKLFVFNLHFSRCRNQVYNGLCLLSFHWCYNCCIPTQIIDSYPLKIKFQRVLVHLSKEVCVKKNEIRIYTEAGQYTLMVVSLWCEFVVENPLHLCVQGSLLYILWSSRVRVCIFLFCMNASYAHKIRLVPFWHQKVKKGSYSAIPNTAPVGAKKLAPSLVLK